VIARTDAGWAIPGNRWDLLDGVIADPPPSVSVVVVHYDQPRQLERTLHALARQDHPPELVEIIVVDDGSPVPPVVPDGVRLILQPDRGFRLAAARNAGAAAATGDVLVFLDADTAPEPGYLRHLTRLPALSWDSVTVGRRRHAEFGVGDAAGAGSASPAAFDPVEVVGPRAELPEPRWLREAYERTGNLLELDHRSYRFLIGAVLACSRRFFVETGGFAESFTQYGGEDWEWVYRAWLHGAVIAHVPEAVAWHDGPDSSARTEAGRAGAALATKNDEALRLADLIPVPGSRGWAIEPGRADIVVTGPPPGATPGQAFVTLDSVLAALPGAVVAQTRASVGPVDGAEPGSAPPTGAHLDGARLEGAHLDGARLEGARFDRVRLEVVIQRPVRVHAGALAPAVAAAESDAYAEVVLRNTSGAVLLRLVSRRAAARQRRWGGDPLLPTLSLSAPEGIDELTSEVNLEAYLGGW
jgi:GT2 family glycosyltransferase